MVKINMWNIKVNKKINQMVKNTYDLNAGFKFLYSCKTATST